MHMRMEKERYRCERPLKGKRIMVDSLKETKNGFLVLCNTPERWEELKKFPLLPGDVFIVT